MRRRLFLSSATERPGGRPASITDECELRSVSAASRDSAGLRCWRLCSAAAEGRRIQLLRGIDRTDHTVAIGIVDTRITEILRGVEDGVVDLFGRSCWSY